MTKTIKELTVIGELPSASSVICPSSDSSLVCGVCF